MREIDMLYTSQYGQAVCFFLFLLAFTLFCIVMAFASSGPIVVGTELNTNGVVEYLCLGKGCETLP